MERSAIKKRYIYSKVTKIGSTVGDRFHTSKPAFSNYLLVKV